MTRRLLVLSIVLAGLTGTLFARQAAPAPMPGALSGRWLGKVVADVGEMPIEVRLTLADGKVTGEIRTFHGSLRIESAERQDDGRWKLPFTDEEGLTGSIVGSVSEDVFAGDWNYAPRAVGKFEVKRAQSLRAAPAGARRP